MPGTSPRTPSAAEGSTEEKLTALQAQLVDEVRRLRTGDDWQRWLAVAARFHDYSFGNTMLILAQRPDATAVAGYQAWKGLGRQVSRGEHGIRIFAPVVRRRADPDIDNTPEETRPRIVGYRVTHVWDVAQTTGTPLPVPPTPKLLQGQAPEGLWDALAEIVAGEGYRLERGPCGGANGYTDPVARIVRVREDVDDAQTVKTLIHELGHVRLHAADSQGPIDCRGVIEVEAESVAYLTAATHGLDTSSYTFPYVTAWAHQVPGTTPEQVVQNAGTRTLATARWLLQHTTPETPQPSPELARRVTAAVTTAAKLADEPRLSTRNVHLAPAARAVRNGRYARLLEAHAEAARYFGTDVDRSWVPGYLRGRGLEAALESPWDAGYAPARWTGLLEHLRAQGFDDQTMLASKLVTRAKTGRLIDRFRDRLTLPLRDPDGTVVAFIGRAHPDADPHRTPKYLNSPNTDLYTKSRYLYGLAEARPAIAIGARAVLVEGPLDAIAVTAGTAGRCAGIATCGTAFTADHARELASALEPSDRRIVVATDADTAGLQSATRILPLLTSHELEGLAAAIPAGTDPAHLLERHGAAALVTALTDRSGPLLDHIIDARLAAHEPRLHWVEGRLAALADVAPLIAAAPPDQRQKHSERLVQRLQLLPHTVENQIAQAIHERVRPSGPPVPRAGTRARAHR